jgi:hypothetical protein
MKYLAPLLALAIIAPAFAGDAPATQPSEKPKARQNDAPPRKAVPLVVKEAKDLWRLLPEELRPGKDGKVSDELSGKVEAWLKENGKNVVGQVQFVSTDTASHPSNVDAFNCVLKDARGTILTAPVTDPKEIAKVQDVKRTNKEKVAPEVSGPVAEVKLVKAGNTSRLSVELKESKILSVKLAKKTS